MSFLAGRRGRVRPLLQLGLADCGPACLRMVLGRFGRHVSVRELTSEPISARDGVTAAWLITCAQRQGLHAEGFEVSVDQLAALPTPAILHTTSSHFVVFEGLARDRVVIVDPSVGERWFLYDEEARKLFSGTAIAFEPTDQFQRRSRLRLTLHALSPMLALDRRASALLATVGITLTALSCTLGTDWLSSSLAGSPLQIPATLTVVDRTAVLLSVLALCVIPLLRLVDATVRSQVSVRLARLGRGLLTDQRGRNVAPHGSTHAPHFARIDPSTASTFPNVSGIILTVSALVGAALTSWSTGRSVPILLAAFSASLAVSLLAAHITSNTASRPARRSAVTVHVVWCAHLLLSLVIWLGALHLDDTVRGHLSEIPFPDEALTIVPQLFLAVATFRTGGIVALGLRWVAMYERLWEGLPDESFQTSGNVLDSAGPADVPAAPLPHLPLLQVRRVAFHLGDKRDRLLSELEFDLNEGDRVAIVGPAGAGKTTLIRAILGRLGASSGTILYRGRFLSEYAWAEREQFVRGMVQGDCLPDGKISRILQGDDHHASLRQLRAMCALLGFDEDFSGLPLGYETPVYYDGDSLSRGERQMLLLAQAVASGARVLALDDPVNSLDDVAARRVLSGLAALPVAVVITMASAAPLSGLDFRVVRLNDVAQEHEGRSDTERALISGR